MKTAPPPLAESATLVALRASEARLRAIFDNEPECVKLIAADGSLLEINLAGLRMIEADSLQQVENHCVYQFVVAEHRPAFEALTGKVFAGETGKLEFQIVGFKGGRRWLETHASPLRDASGKVTALLGITRDITERKEAEETLRNSESLYHSLVESLPQNIFRKDLAGRFIFANRSLCLALGRPLSEVLGKSDDELFPPELAAKYQADDRRVIETGQPFKAEEKFLTGDGRVVHVEVTKTPLLDAAGKAIGVQGIFHDVTEEKMLAEQLRQSQKLDAIGQLSGGVAHDFNNLLTIINGYTEMLLDDEGIAPKTIEPLKQIYMAGERAAKLTRQLLAFSRKKPLQLQPLHLDELVNDVAKMLRRLIGENIAVQLNESPRLPATQADAGMLEQVLLNLAVNARDAMPRGGQLIISTTAHLIDEAYVRCHANARSGEFVCLSVRDTGCGMPPEILAHIFEPFFTTKELAKGTGLGLATVYGIVKQHEGWMEVESEPGVGTTFKVFLPVAARAGATGDTTATLLPVRCGQETILLVEDEAAVRMLAVIALQRQGYRVLEAVSGEEALEVWHRHGPKIDLLLTDMVMPGDLSGRELAEQLRDLKPTLKVIFTSGYSAEKAGQIFEFKDQTPFLEKPYNLRKLAEVVRQLLDESSEAGA